jgi:hypothetical protein
VSSGVLRVAVGALTAPDGRPTWHAAGGDDKVSAPRLMPGRCAPPNSGLADEKASTS